jgi:hypothetical protein
MGLAAIAVLIFICRRNRSGAIHLKPRLSRIGASSTKQLQHLRVSPVKAPMAEGDEIPGLVRSKRIKAYDKLADIYGLILRRRLRNKLAVASTKCKVRP